MQVICPLCDGRYNSKAMDELETEVETFQKYEQHQRRLVGEYYDRALRAEAEVKRLREAWDVLSNYGCRVENYADEVNERGRWVTKKWYVSLNCFSPNGICYGEAEHLLDAVEDALQEEKEVE